MVAILLILPNLTVLNTLRTVFVCSSPFGADMVHLRLLHHLLILGLLPLLLIVECLLHGCNLCEAVLDNLAFV